MNATLLGKFLRLLGALLRSRVETTVAAQAELGGEITEAFIDVLWRILREHRRLAYQATVLHLQHEALSASKSVLGAPRAAWAPPEPGYSRQAVRELLRRSPGGISSPSGVARAAERHMYAASRQTVVAAVSPSAPGEPVESVDEFLQHLDGYPAGIRKEIEREARKHAVKASPAPGMTQKEAEEWLGSLEGLDPTVKERLISDLAHAIGVSPEGEPADQVLRELMERVQRARDEVLASQVLKSEKDQAAVRKTAQEALAAAGSDTPPEAALKDPEHEYWRLDKKGRRIARPWAWARVVQPSEHGPCGFCVVMASRGPCYRNSYSAGLRVDRFHTNCKCKIIPVYTSRRWFGKSASQDYARLYKRASKSGKKGRDLLNHIDALLRESRKESAG